ncbi:hypothetical protein [Haloechinothrix salitolerans]|uniref:Uncharacterized protein n=1 Tax=Haloechinothrix salitolerans TaxID=926830 RepID=A0ABW2C739_9PSEU
MSDMDNAPVPPNGLVTAPRSIDMSHLSHRWSSNHEHVQVLVIDDAGTWINSIPLRRLPSDHRDDFNEYLKEKIQKAVSKYFDKWMES